MKGMPHLHYASGAGHRAHWVGSTLYVNQDAADVRRTYQREDALPIPEEKPATEPRRPSLSTFVRRLVGSAGA